MNRLSEELKVYKNSEVAAVTLMQIGEEDNECCQSSSCSSHPGIGSTSEIEGNKDETKIESKTWDASKPRVVEENDPSHSKVDKQEAIRRKLEENRETLKESKVNMTVE